MARKSGKYPAPKLTTKPSRKTVGYIRLSVRDKDPSGSIKNQRLIIEGWGAGIRFQLCVIITSESLKILEAASLHAYFDGFLNRNDKEGFFRTFQGVFCMAPEAAGLLNFAPDADDTERG